MSSGKGIDNLSQGVRDINLGSSKEGVWEDVSRKKKNRAGSNSGREWGPWSQQRSAPTAWGQPDTAQRLGIHNSNASGAAPNTPARDVRGQGGRGMRPQPPMPGTSVTAPPVEHGWTRAAARVGSSQVRQEIVEKEEDRDDDEEEEGDVYSDDDDDLLSDGSDSDEGPETHETRKQHRMLKGFFEIMDKLTVPELNDPVRQWHCPACQGGPGAIDWYKGLQPLMAHGRTKGSQRVKLHRKFADILDEELRRRGTSVIPAGQSFGQWEGLKQEKDHEIVWPPMVVIMNTQLDQDENEKWLGMGNQELLDYFDGYAAVKARHSYGPKGHRGMSILIFESSAVGYGEAERLHKHFLGDGTGRTAWESNRRVLFYPGGLRKLYGFLARKEDLDEFNKHCQGSKTRVKFEMRSYQEMVVSQMKQMSEDNQQLTFFKNKAAKEQRHSKALKESLSVVSEKLRKTVEEYRIVRQRTQMQHEQNKEEMDFQEQFFKEQIEKIHETTYEKEDNFERLQQEERKKVEDHRNRAEEVTKFKELQDQEMQKFDEEREKLIEMHGSKKMEMKKRHWEEEVQLEREFDAALTELMDKYTPRSAAADGAPAARA